MEEAAGGKRPAGEGWFVVNARETLWTHNRCEIVYPVSSSRCVMERA